MEIIVVVGHINEGINTTLVGSESDIPFCEFS